MKKLFEEDLKVVNVGLQGFANNITAAGGQVTNMTWAPPAGADAALGWTLANLVGDPRIEEANRIAYDRYLGAQPRLVDLVRASEAIAGLGPGRAPHPALGAADRLAGHVRPAARRHRRRHPLRGLGRRSRGRRETRRKRCRWHWSRATSTARSDRWPASSARRCRCGWWRTPRPGTGPTATSTRAWARCCGSAPTPRRCSTGCGGWAASSSRRMQVAVRGLADPDLKPLMAQALHMGDELHNRNAAASALLFKRLTLSLLDSDVPADAVRGRWSSSPATTTSSSTSRWRRASR